MPFIIENAEITIVTQPTANNLYNFNPRRQELTDLWIDYWVEANTGCNKKKQIIQWNWSCINWKANIPILSKYALHHFLWYSLSSSKLSVIEIWPSFGLKIMTILFLADWLVLRHVSGCPTCGGLYSSQYSNRFWIRTDLSWMQTNQHLTFPSKYTILFFRISI